MMKTSLLVVAAIATLTAPALAGKPKKKPIAEMKSAKKDVKVVEHDALLDLNLGDKFELGGRLSAKPGEEVDQIKPRSLTDNQLQGVFGKRMDDIQMCWNRLPAKQRIDLCSAIIKVSINESGMVTAVELGGDVPAAAHKCITAAVGRWQFPLGEMATTAEFGLNLRSY